MLQELSIKNFAIISSLQISFEDGMTVLTGETGAGKSIIIDAMGLLVGGRGSVDYIRQGEQKCTLEGMFSLPTNKNLARLLEKNSIDIEDQVLIIQRDIFKSGKNVCRINGRMINTAILRKIGSFLVDIHGQNEHQELMQAENHLKLLDEFAGEEVADLKNKYEESYQIYKELKSKHENKQKNEKEFAQRMDMLRFQCEEIEAADLHIGEEEELLEERNRLNNFQKIVGALKNSYEALQGGETSSVDGVGYAMNAMLEIETIDQEYLDVSDTIKNSYYALQEVANDLSRMMDSLEMDEDRLNYVETRLDNIRQLKRKYGDTVVKILDYYETISLELTESEKFEESNENMEIILEKQKKKTMQFAHELSKRRTKIARVLEQEILQQLQELYMEKTQFEVVFKEDKKMTIDGIDQVEFFISTNVGEAMKPLVKVVSGGELSRMMLAMKTIFSKTQGITSIVFDEVDTGVSGRVAQAIANKIHQVAKNSQVLCITHLPQVAAVADHQYLIKKTIMDNRTQTSVVPLAEEERIEGIAHMLSGDEVTTLTLEHAKELLDLAKK